MRAISDLSTLVFLNILTVIFCIPIVTAGASLAAMHYVIMEMMEERGGGLVSEFWKRFRENLRNATPDADPDLCRGVRGDGGLCVRDPADSEVRVFHRRSVQKCSDPGDGISASDDPDDCDHSGDPLPARECLKAYAAVLPARIFAPGLPVCAAVHAGV